MTALTNQFGFYRGGNHHHPPMNNIIVNQYQNTCYKIPNVGNPILLLKELLEYVEEKMELSKIGTIKLIKQKKDGDFWIFVFSTCEEEEDDRSYIAIKYEDKGYKGSVVLTIFTEDLDFINESLGLDCDDDQVLECPDLYCSWWNKCDNPKYMFYYLKGGHNFNHGHSHIHNHANYYHQPVY